MLFLSFFLLPHISLSLSLSLSSQSILLKFTHPLTTITHHNTFLYWRHMCIWSYIHSRHISPCCCISYNSAHRLQMVLCFLKLVNTYFDGYLFLQLCVLLKELLTADIKIKKKYILSHLLVLTCVFILSQKYILPNSDV